MEETTPNGNGNLGNGDGNSSRKACPKPRRSASRGTARWNALKHGVLSEGAVLPNEDRSQFEELHNNLREDLRPQGALEELLVEKIAICFWRLRRLLRYDFENNQKSAPLLAAGDTCVDATTCIKELADIREFLAKDGPTSPEQFMKLMTLGTGSSSNVTATAA